MNAFDMSQRIIKVCDNGDNAIIVEASNIINEMLEETAESIRRFNITADLGFIALVIQQNRIWKACARLVNKHLRASNSTYMLNNDLYMLTIRRMVPNIDEILRRTKGGKS